MALYSGDFGSLDTCRVDYWVPKLESFQVEPGQNVKKRIEFKT